MRAIVLVFGCPPAGEVTVDKESSDLCALRASVVSFVRTTTQPDPRTRSPKPAFVSFMSFVVEISHLRHL
jgi:hypothetical protein